MTAVLLPLQGANIGRRASQAETRRAITAVRHGVTGAANPRPDLLPAVCWQEVNDDNAPVDERDLIGDAFPAPTFTTYPRFDRRKGALVPITMPAPWACEDPQADQWATLMSHGRELVQPDRYLTVRVMAHPLLRHAPLAVVSWQMVQGAFTDPGQKAEAYRHHQWLDVQWPTVKAQVTELVRDGITVAYEADTNRPRCPLIRWDDERVIQQGLDALGWVPGRSRHALQVAVRRTWRVPLGIDGHDGLGALLALS